MQSNSIANSGAGSNTPNNRAISKIIISSPVVSVLVLVFVETMFFSALLSSFFVMKKGRDIWNTAGSIPIPVFATGFNTLILLASGIPLFLAAKAFKKNKDLALAGSHLLRAIGLGGFFLAFQAFLSVRLINAGLTINSSVFGGCFHLITGAHLIQVILGIAMMSGLYLKISNFKTESSATTILTDRFNAVQIFWIFVMVIWPVLYAEIYF